MPLVGSAQPRVTPTTWQFWPWWDTCEPDVVIADDDVICVIEAKLYAEFGEEAAAGTQLTREWCDGLRRSVAAGKQFWLVAVTNHATVPEGIIRKQLDGSGADLSRVCWMSWQDIGRVLTAAPASGWREDLLELMAQMGLAPFRGFSETIEHIPKAILTTLPWCDRPLLRVEVPSPVGFNTVLCLCRPMSAGPAQCWRFAGGRSEAEVGFGRALSATLQWWKRGDERWRFRKN